MEESVFAAETQDSKGNVLDDRSGSLSMDLIAVDKGVFEEWSNGIDVVLCHFTNVFKEERE